MGNPGRGHLYVEGLHEGGPGVSHGVNAGVGKAQLDSGSTGGWSTFFGPVSHGSLRSFLNGTGEDCAWHVADRRVWISSFCPISAQGSVDSR